MAINWGTGSSMAIQGAKLGSNFGLAGAAAGAAAGFILGSSAKDHEKIMMDKYNAEVVKNAARDLFDMRRVQNEENKRTSMALLQYQDNRTTQNSAIIAQMGAAEATGGSADALRQTLDFMTTEAMNMTMLNAIQGVDNYNTKIDQMTNQRDGQLKRTREGGGVDAGKLLSSGIGLYKQFSGDGSLDKGIANTKSLLGNLSSVWQTKTPVAIETSNPAWIDKSAKNAFNASVGN